MALAADPIELEPGTEEWLREMTASKVAAVLGLSPWESRFSLWYRMKGVVDGKRQTASMERGHYLEDAVARWLADQVGVVMTAGGCWRNRARPWQVASPDRLCGGATGPLHVEALAEVKTAADWEHWGPDGSDEIPPYYRAQVVWQCDTLGLDTAHVGVLLPRLHLRAYTLHPADGEAEYVREEVRAFLDSLAADEPPEVDGHKETYVVLRNLHHLIEDRDEDVPLPLAREYRSAVLALRAAEDAHAEARARMAAHMGKARRAVVDGRVLAIRQTNGRGDPYVKATDRMPALEEEG